MLLIDAAAKDGNVHLVSGEGWKEPTLARWCADLPGWVDQGGMPLPIQPTSYAPMPLVLRAVEMREALDDTNRQLKGFGYVHYLSNDVLAATEWPPKEGDQA
ncbi:MAG TPA: hypothetical protein VIK69_02200 [Methylophilaceae bacterium]